MNAPGEIAALAAPGAAAGRDDHDDRARPSRLLPVGRGDRRAKGEIFGGLEPGGVAVLNLDDPHSPQLGQLAEAAGCGRVIGFGARAGAAVRLQDASSSRTAATSSRRSMAPSSPTGSARPGGIGSATAWACSPASWRSAPIPLAAAAALADFRPPKGRGARHRLQRARRRGHADRRELQRQPGLDARRARAARGGARPPARGARRHARARRAGGRAARGAGRAGRGRGRRSRVHGRRRDAPSARRAAGGAARRPRRARRASCCRSSRPSCGRRHAPDQGLARHRHGPAGRGAARRSPRRSRAERRCCSISCSRSPTSSALFNLFRYLTFRTGGAVLTALVISFVVGPGADPLAARAPGPGPADPRGRPGLAHLAQAGHADHGRHADPARADARDAALGRPHQRLCLGRAADHAQLRRHRPDRRLPQAHQALERRARGAHQVPRPVPGRADRRGCIVAG